ncbi:MAG TPA: hypothetical protein VJ986_01640 [Gaiellaceae bacterium]|nr:hypothetical protein [Gaiellaceae bacterium]
MTRSRVGTPAPFPLVASFLVAGLACWLLASVALLRAAPDLARGWVATPATLLAVHLLALGFLPLAVAGAALHVLPTLLRSSGDPRRCWIGFAGLCAGPFLAVGIARHQPQLTWTAAALVGLGLLSLLLEIGLLVARAPHDRMLLASRFGVAASGLHALLAFLLGSLLFVREWRPWLGIPHERLIAIHLHLAVFGWLTLLIVAVGRTLAPMLALAPSEPVRRRPIEEIVLTAGLWLAILGFALDRKALLAAGTATIVAVLGRFVVVLVRAAHRSHMEAMEGPIAHFLAGVVFLAQAAALAVALLLRSPSPRTLSAYVLLLLLGWAAGITLGHVGKLLALSAWTWWPPGPRPKQAAFYARRSWIAAAVAFAAGTELLAVGTLTGTTGTARAGGAFLVLSALAALHGAAGTLAHPRPAPAPRPQALPDRTGPS